MGFHWYDRKGELRPIANDEEITITSIAKERNNPKFKGQWFFLKSVIFGHEFRFKLPDLKAYFSFVSRGRRRLSATQILASRQHRSSPELERLVSEVRAEHQ